MQVEDISLIAMACFVEGIDPVSLALPSHHVLRVESVLQELKGESETDAYYRCLEALSVEGQGDIL